MPSVFLGGYFVNLFRSRPSATGGDRTPGRVELESFPAGIPVNEHILYLKN
jgi:hypothetical protein